MRVVPFRKPLRRPAAWSRGRRKPGAARALLGRPRRWIGMLRGTMIPILSVFLLLSVALTFGNLSGTGATPGPAGGIRDGAITGRASVIDGDTIEILTPGLAVGIEERDGAITGRASVVDGDTIEIHGQRIRLSGKIISCFGGGICSGGSLGLPSPAPLAC